MIANVSGIYLSLRILSDALVEKLIQKSTTFEYMMNKALKYFTFRQQYIICRAYDYGRSLVHFLTNFGTRLTKSNLTRQIYYTLSMGKSVNLQEDWTIFNPYHKSCIVFADTKFDKFLAHPTTSEYAKNTIEGQSSKGYPFREDVITPQCKLYIGESFCIQLLVQNILKRNF